MCRTFLQCEICNDHNGILIVLENLTHEYCWFHCYSHKNSTNHRMFFSIFWKIGNSFSFSSALDHSPDSRMILMLQTIPFLLHRFPWWKLLENWYHQVALIFHEMFLRTLRIARFRREGFLRDQVELVVPFSKEFYQVTLIYLIQQLISMDLDFRNVSNFMNHLFWFWTQRFTMIDSVVFLKNMSIRVVLKSSESILERGHFAIAVQQNVVVLEFWNTCLPQFVHELNLSVWSVLASWKTSWSSCSATMSLSNCPGLSRVCSTLRL